MSPESPRQCRNARASAERHDLRVAPLAYLGNYKALTVPTASVGLNGNSPELVAAIEAAVADGMDVINLSLGEPEVEPARDAVGARSTTRRPPASSPSSRPETTTSSAAARSALPGTPGRAITVGARPTGRPAMAPFSASGPTPLGLAAKPDVSAPGVDILSARRATRS